MLSMQKVMSDTVRWTEQRQCSRWLRPVASVMGAEAVRGWASSADDSAAGGPSKVTDRRGKAVAQTAAARDENEPANAQSEGVHAWMLFGSSANCC
jgi:hypothetical protein